MPSLRSLLDDRPVKTELWHGLEKLADRLAKGLPRFPTSSPVLVSGPWGSGKTSLLKAIKEKLDPEDKPPTGGANAMKVSLFEAWRYEGEMPIFAALVRQILHEAQESEAVQEQESQEQFSKRRDRLWKSTVAFCGGVGPGLAGILGGPMGAASAAFVKGLVTAEKVDSKSSDSSDPALQALLEDRSEALWTAFGDLLKLAYPAEDDNKGPALLVLIDDLDRCSPEGTIQLLEGIRHFVARSEDLPIRFVAALDRGVLARLIARKFEGFDAYEGNRYLEKIFPLVFNLPRPTLEEIDGLVSDYAGDLGLADEDREVARSVFTDEMFANPRLIKRVLNRFALWLDYENPDGSNRSSEKESRRRVILVAWLAACERWPGLRGLLARRKSQYWQELWSYARNNGGPGAGRLDSVSASTGVDHPPDPDAEKILQEQDLRSWLKGRDEAGSAFEYAELSLQKWGL